jgi:hypothetical protein
LEEIQEINLNGQGEIKENMPCEKSFAFLFQPNIYLEYKTNRACIYYLFICTSYLTVLKKRAKKDDRQKNSCTMGLFTT